MEERCPVCQHVLSRHGETFHCAFCHRRFLRQALCPDCGRPLEKLIACGAVDYFCPHGDGLISKKRVSFNFVAQ
ncbi:zinc ribbon domain-containing protein [Martelella alba]|uniref:Primosomal protein N' (Replication factor Y)-superfamily II helicase n=1 Tax=Martelella alba TaxID=2590451 RepID=A0ABY2SPW4_9HYPH|nr:zinc ribbon domain-containing protein [Martelella alba]TKI06735.1 hypothetical protein FCN80_09075 [Martelella alba]